MKQTLTKYHFDGQRSDEKVLQVLHRHWFDILIQFMLVFFMLILLFGSFGLFLLFYTTFESRDFKNLLFFSQNLFFIFIWMTSFIIWIDYYFDIWIVTDQRIINVEQKGLFVRETSELELEKIQDVATNVHGMISTFLNYGDIQVQTAGEQEKFLFYNIPDPYQVKDLIMKLQEKFEKQEENEFGELLNKKIHHEEEI